MSESEKKQLDASGASVCKPSALASRRGAAKRPVLDLPARVCLRRPSSPGEVISKDYQLYEVLGSGSTAQVQHAVRRIDGQHVALKKMRSSDPEMIKTARREFELLKKIPPHPYIIQAIDFHSSSTQAFLVMEFFAGTTLDRAIRSAPNKCFPERTARVLGTALFQAVGHLHAHNILHRDIKPENLLISLDLVELRLVDFNVAHCLDDGPSLTPTGTELYKAPEALKGQALTKSCDVWTSALCLFLMLSGHLPNRQDQSYYVGEKLKDGEPQAVALEGRRWHHVSEPCKVLLSSCLAFDADERPTMAAVLEDEWVKSTCSPESDFSWLGLLSETTMVALGFGGD